MVDKFRDPLLALRDVARHIQIPQSTVYSWLHDVVNGAPLIHSVSSVKRGQPSVPFVGVVEAYVLRSLRELGLAKSKIIQAVSAVRSEFATPYALATKRIATDGIDIFVHYAGNQLARVGDSQYPIRDVIDDYLRFISWDTNDESPAQLRLRQYSDIAPVIIDPRFAWGEPVVESTKVPVDAIVDLWLAGESLDDVAYEYDMTREQVEVICRVARTA